MGITVMFDDYTKTAEAHLKHVHNLLDAVKSRQLEGGPDRNKLENLEGLLAQQIKKLRDIKFCIIRLDPDQEVVEEVPQLTVASVPKSFKKPISKKDRRYKRFVANTRPRAKNMAPTSRSKEKRRQKVNKTKQLRADAIDGCTGKIKLSHDEAVASGSRILETSTDPKLWRMAVYNCMVCGEYHLTRQVHSAERKGSTQVTVLIKETVT